ncbi:MULTISPECIES: DUF3592 domain-containing protein [unclassified Kitasatospora]|uniref:DUF3592 domain-containing protein n=1 Tax=unclassified Kitasatospora TaxID=2633591 RepID=UPI00340F24D8
MNTVALAFGALLGIGAGFCARETYRVHQVRRRGVRTVGRVLYVRTDTDGDGDLQYHPVVRFELPDGTRVEAESATGTPHSCSLEPDDEVELAYLPSWPKAIVILGFDGLANPWVYGFITLLIGGSAALLLWGSAAP